METAIYFLLVIVFSGFAGYIGYMSGKDSESVKIDLLEGDLRSKERTIADLEWELQAMRSGIIFVDDKINK